MEQAIEQYKDPGPMSVENMKAQVNLIQHMLKEVMKKDVHYGVIPGCGDKPTLFKAGAEKISMTFRLSPTYKVETVNMVDDMRHREVEVICTLTHIPTGQVFGQGVGCCSTMEGKYRFRNAKRKCPKCDQEAIIKGKEEYGGGWLCWKKNDGCGEKFDDNDPLIINQDAGQIEHDNPADYYNTVLKMAKKRAHVDAVLTATAASDCFYQDIEDMPEVIPGAKGKAEPVDVEVVGPDQDDNYQEQPQKDVTEQEWLEEERKRDEANRGPEGQEDIPFQERPFPGDKEQPTKINQDRAKVLYAKWKHVPDWSKEDRQQFLDDIGYKSLYDVTEDDFQDVKKQLDSFYGKK